VHGNESAGTQAIERVLAAFDHGDLRLLRGRVSFVPVTNPLARDLGTRAGQRNLNRNLRPSAVPQDFEDRLANVLCPLLDTHDVLLDLHSFQSRGQPFAMLGPEDNTGLLEPFAQARAEARLAVHLGPRRIVEGWLSTFEAGVRARRARAAATGGPLPLECDAQYGVGTTEYMRARGGYAVTLECGQHADPAAPAVGERAILQALKLLGLVAGEPEPPAAPFEVLRLVEVTDRLHAGDRFAREWASFDRVAAGEPIGVRADGTVVAAPADGHVVFPNARAEPGHEWFYFAQPSPRSLI
jgi:predicted deacylase